MALPISPLVSDSAEAVKMLLPVIRFDRSVGNGVSAVEMCIRDRDNLFELLGIIINDNYLY